jgi:hypothetical protein
MGGVVDACHGCCRAWWRGGRGSASPLHALVAHHRCNLYVRWWRIPPPSGRGQAVPDPPAREGRQSDAKGCGGASTIAAGAVGSERPGLQPRAASPSPLKGAVRRPDARVDRLGAGAVGISRLQPAWGLSPAVHGRAMVDTASADPRCVSCETCQPRGIAAPGGAAGEAAPRPYMPWWRVTGATCACDGGGSLPRPVGVRRCLTRRPGRAGE